MVLPSQAFASWQKTYDHSGSEAHLYHWQISGQPGHETATPVTFDAKAATWPNDQVQVTSLGIAASRELYYPTPDMKSVYLEISAAVVLKTKTTFTWQGPGNAPATLKVCLDGDATSSWDAETGSVSANNGLGDGSQDMYSYGPIHVSQGGNHGPYDMYFSQVVSNGKHYREFPVVNGKVQFVTIQTATTTSKGIGDEDSDDLVATCAFNATESNWGVKVISNRDMTYRRVVGASGTITRMPNNLEDDGISQRGANGKISGDSVATEPNPYNGWERDYASTFNLSISSASGAFGTGTQIGITSGATLTGGGTGEAQLVAGYENIPDSASRPLKQFNVTGWLHDPVNHIDDSYIYAMLVHLQAEKESVLGTYSQDYLYWTKDSPIFQDYHSAQYAPEILLDRAAAGSPVEITLTVSNQVTSESGFEYTSTSGAELSAEIAKILFSKTFTISGSITVSDTNTEGEKITIPAGRRLEIWRCPFGTLTKHLTTRWDDHGYVKDANDYVMDNYTEEVKYWTRLVGDAQSTPHLSDGGVAP